MSEYGADALDAFREHLTFFGVPAMVGTFAATVCADRSMTGLDLVEGGVSRNGDTSIKLVATDLPTPPEIKTPVTYAGRNYYVQEISDTRNSGIATLKLRAVKGK